MTKYAKLTLSDAMAQIVERYRVANNLLTTTQAINELIIAGYCDWVGEQPSPTPAFLETVEAEEAMFDEYEAVPPPRPEFHLWFAERFGAKWGGRRG